MTVIRTAVVILAVAFSLNAAEMRTWTDSRGRTLEAELIGESEGKVTLRTPEGRTVTTQRTTLSQADRAYLDSLEESKPAPQLATPEPRRESAGPPPDNSPLLTEADRFGICLGESTETLEWNCRKAGKNIDKDTWVYQDKDHPGRIWSFQGALNGNKAIKTTKVSVYNGRVYEVEVLFKDSSLQNYNVLTESLEEKYGKNKAGLFDAMESKSGFTTTDGDHKVQIILNHDIGFMEDNTLSLRYVHDKLSGQVLEELKKQKADKVADDL